jgi:hypothetical protein
MSKLFEKVDARGKYPESWACVDCGVNTAPGCLNRVQVEQALMLAAARTGRTDQGVAERFDDRTEVYMVKPKVWKASGMGGMDGCLCIGCLEKRLGRILTPKDFLRDHPFNSFPGTRRLRARRKGLKSPAARLPRRRPSHDGSI